MKFDLLDENSIILAMGDIKLSDTDETFGKSKIVNQYKYEPILNPKNSFPKKIFADIAYGDYKCGTTISNDEKSILLAYGANRINSNAQSMAIGYFDGSQYFFVVEAFEDIYRKEPELVARRIVNCKSLWSYDQTEKEIWYRGKTKGKLTQKDLKYFKELSARIEMLEPALKEENLNSLRMQKCRNGGIEYER